MSSTPEEIHDSDAARSEGATTRTGYVTLVGRPNAGKSTLLNALLERPLSIVTSKAQTTWERVAAIDTRGDVQMIFLDTPGLLQPRDLLQRSMLATALEALREADVVLAVVDATSATGSRLTKLGATLDESGAPRIVVVNKTDIARPDQIQTVVTWAETELGVEAFPVSGLRATGLEALRAALAARLPEGPFLFDQDDLAARPTRFFVAELIRETVFERYRQEIPYSVMCRVDEFREGQDPVYIGVTLFVEKPSQKRIVVGERGAAIKDLGRASREKVEHFLDRSVYLDLWVKVLPGWRRRRTHLARLGFHVPEGDDAGRQ
jgi:GTP-binding protein Era